MNTFNGSSRIRARSLEFTRAFMTEYNENIRLHNEMMSEYNRNVTRMIGILHQPTVTPVQSTSRSDIETLIYLLSQNNTLSRIQIENATRLVAYNAETFSSTQCPISLDDFVENEIVCQIIHCRHIFKQRNIMRWLETHTCCPVCRHDLIESEENTNIQSNFNTDISGNTLEFPMRFNERNW